MPEGFIRGMLGVQMIVILVALVVLSYQFGRQVEKVEEERTE